MMSPSNDRLKTTSQIAGRVVVIVIAVIFSSLAIADQPRLDHINRRSSRADDDIHRGLINDGRYRDIIDRSRRMLAVAVADSDSAAHAVIRWTAANVAAQHAGEPIVPTEQTLGPIEQMIQAYPNHPRILFLQTAAHRFELDQVRTATELRLIAGSNRDDESLSRRLVQLRRRCDSLASASKQQQTAADATTAAVDYGRLHRSLITRGVVIDRLQSRLYPAGSADGQSAAAAAVRSAETAIDTLPPTSTAAQRVRLLLALSLEDAGLLADAADQLENLPTDDPQTTALAMRLQIANGNNDVALSIYQSVSPPTLPTDLAMLKLKLKERQSSDQVVPFIGQIENRHGRYARRLAEAMMLENLAAASTSTSTSTSNASRDAKTPNRPVASLDDSGESAAGLVAIQAADQIRRGNKIAGGRMMVLAAARSTQISEAIKHTVTAAAALQTGSANEAIDVLVATAERFEANVQTETLATTAIALAAKESPSRLNALLPWFVDRFADSDKIDVYRDWLVRVESQSGTPLAAAMFARGEDSRRRWRALFADADASGGFNPATDFNAVTNFNAVTEGLIDHVRQLQSRSNNEPAHASNLRRWAGHWLDVDDLRAFGAGDDVSPLTRFRLGLSGSLSEIDADEVWRLIRDGIRQPDRRTNIAQQFDQLAPPLDRLQKSAVAAWLGRDDEAIRIIDAELDVQSPVQNHVRAAEILATGSNRLVRRAVQIHDQIASRSPTGSETWLSSKWSAIKLLRTFDKQDAVKRARYILLTVGALDPTWKRRFESAAR